MGRSIVGYKLDQIKKEKRKRNFIAFDLQLDRLRLLVDSAAISTVPHGGTYTLALSCAVEMARGGAMVAAADAGAGAGVAPGYSSEITFTVVMSCLMAASGGLIFGYDISITGQSVTRSVLLHICHEFLARLYIGHNPFLRPMIIQIGRKLYMP